MTLIERLAKEAGMPAKDYLEGLVKQHRKAGVIAMVLDATPMTIYQSAKRLGVDLPNPYAFAMDDIEDTAKGHCKRLNVSVGSVRVRIHRCKIGPAQAIRDQLESDKKFGRGRFKRESPSVGTSGLSDDESGLLGAAAEAAAA